MAEVAEKDPLKTAPKDAASPASSEVHEGMTVQEDKRIKELDIQFANEASQRRKEAALNVFDGNTGTIVMSFVTIYALFGDDIRLYGTSEDADIVFYCITCVTIAAFAEFCVFTTCKENYMNSFFFWLDLVALLSLFADVPWIWAPFLNLFGYDSENANSQSLTVTRASRASRAGTRAGRLVRLVRLIRLVRVLKLYKYFGKKGEDEEEEEDVNFSADLGGSAVGSKISDFTTRRVIIGVLVMLFCVPWLDASADDDSASYGLINLQTYTSFASTTNQLEVPLSPTDFDTMVNSFVSFMDGNVLYLKANGTDYVNRAGAIDTRRNVELTKLNLDSNFICWIDIQFQSQQQALYSLIMTIFIICVLGVGAWRFAKDTHDAVIHPIERMINFVKILADNPLAKIEKEEKDEKNQEQFETALLESTLMKLGGLLQVGFGDAGAEIIAKNIQGDRLDPMVPGQKIEAIFGFCDIRNFSLYTECLEERVLKFVNLVAKIVHGACYHNDGHSNKNLGNAFLMIWKFQPSHNAERKAEPPAHSPRGSSLSPSPEEEKKANGAPAARVDQARFSLVADRALVSFLQVQIQITLSNDIKQWTVDRRVVAAMGSRNLSMGFGLHWGWAIEGAIGSEEKIDASYLSPNVNITARLEAASRQFSVNMLVSGEFYSLLQPRIQKRMRHIDRVTVKGSKLPMDLYTFDISPSAYERMEVVAAEADPGSPKHMEKLAVKSPTNKPATKKFEFKLNEEGDIELGARSNETQNIAQKVAEGNVNWMLRKHLTAGQISRVCADLQVGLTDGFITTYNKATMLYIKGYWADAKRMYEKVQEIQPSDKAAGVVLAYMKKRGNVAPEDWEGYRALTSK